MSKSAKSAKSTRKSVSRRECPSAPRMPTRRVPKCWGCCNAKPCAESLIYCAACNAR